MLPTLTAGDFVIASQIFRSIRPGDLVVANHPEYQRIVKRVERVSTDKMYWLSGDHESSVQSEQMGWVKAEQVKAKVLFTIRK